MRFRKPEPIPLLFIIAATVTLAALGGWQVQRLAWKNSLIHTVAEAQSEPALGGLPQELAGLDYRRVALTGRYLHDKTLRKAGGIQGEGPGFFLLTPFILEDDGRAILINRGFSPADKDLRPEGTLTVAGVIRPAREKRFFSPENKPGDNLWFHEDIAAMSQATQLDLLPMVVEATGAREKGVYPVPSDGTISLRNDHLGYALSWFLLALIGLVMFGIYHRVPGSK